MKFQSRRPPRARFGKKKALALTNGLSVFTEDRGLNLGQQIVDECASAAAESQGTLAEVDRVFRIWHGNQDEGAPEAGHGRSKGSA